MENKLTLQTKLRSLFFEVISDDPHFGFNEKLLYEIIKYLANVLQFSFIAIYFLNEWNKKYDRLAVYPKQAKETYQKLPIPNSFSTKKPVQIDEENFFIPIYSNNTFLGYMNCGTYKGEHPQKKSIAIIQNELTHFMEFMRHYNRLKMKEVRLESLHSFTSQIYLETDKSTILENFIMFIEKLYPRFVVNILLTQEHKVKPSLPIKMFEFNGKYGDHLSVNAFLSGESQVEINREAEQLKLYVPLTGQQAVYGVIEIVIQHAIHIPETDLEYLSKMAAFTGKAIEKVALYESSNEQVESLKLINETSKSLTSNTKVEEIIRIIYKKIMKVSHCSELGIVRIEDAHFTILQESTRYFHTEAGRLLTNYFIDNNQEKPFFTGNFNKVSLTPFRSVMVIPMKHDFFNFGLLIVLHEEPYYFTFERFKTIQSLVLHSTLSILNAVLVKKLEETVKTDYVTGLYTRNHLDSEIKEHIKVGNLGTFVLFDIDDFKMINDTFGHPIGDKVLKQVAQIIRENIRKGDIAARWGGEELAVYLPGVTGEKGVEIAKRISSEIEMKTNPLTTVSAGVSVWNEDDSPSVTALFLVADMALYEAKKAGKNRVVVRYNLEAN